MKIARLIFFLSVVLAFSAILNGQVNRQSGVVKGIVIDLNGVPIPGIEVTAKSPALMGVMRSITDENGAFRLINLPPGNYTITAALDGFKTVKRTDIVVQTGQTFTVNLQTELSVLKEEITVSGTPPVVDLQSNKMSNVVTGELLRNLPLSRSINNLFNVTPGSAGIIAKYSGSIQGANSGTTAYEIDGVNGEDPTTGGMMISPQYDSVEEIEITTGGLPPQVGASGGAFISVVTKSGGNSFHGQAQAYYTDKNLTQNLFTDEELQSMGRSKPALPVYDLDMSASLGGPLIKDKLWFYGSMARQGNEYLSTFQPRTLLGTKYDSYNLITTTYAPFLKLTTQINKNMRFFAMFNGNFAKSNFYEPTVFTALDSIFDADSKQTAATGELNWMLGTNTNVNIRGAYNNMDWSLYSKPETRDKVAYVDNYTGYRWNSHSSDGRGDSEWYMIRRTLQGSARLTHFMNNVLGGSHEIGAGIEYVSMLTDTAWARGNPLTIHYYNGNIYYHRGIGDTDPSLGDGLINLSTASANRGDTSLAQGGNRLSGYLQDSFTINNRLTVNFGARLDKYWGGFNGGATAGTDPNGLAYKVGLEMAKTLGFNHYAADTWDAYKESVIDLMVISPRIGASYDLFGDSKTALKVAWGSFYEAIPAYRYEGGLPFNCYNFAAYNWFDRNGNGIPDDPGIDIYAPANGYSQFVQPEESIIRDKLASNPDPNAVSAPHNNEILVSLSHELAKNFSVKLQYINKLGYGDHVTVQYYDRTNKQYWFSLQDAPVGYWVPFTTVVPAVGMWPEKEVTVYFRSNNAPERFQRGISNPYSKRLYNGIELTFDKRYAGGWALGGSVAYSQSKSQNPSDPNRFVNGWGFDTNDVPLAISIYGSFKLPYKLVGSFIYRHLEGGPLNTNDVTIFAPGSWIAANNVNPSSNGVAVMLEPKGTHRGPAYDNIDFRLEKEFKFKFATISFFADIFNLLGNKYVNVGQNVGGNWRPAGPGVSTGTRTYDAYYNKIQSVSGMRTFKLSARISF